MEPPALSPPYAGLCRCDPGLLQEVPRGKLFRAHENLTSWVHKEALACDGWADRARL